MCEIELSVITGTYNRLEMLQEAVEAARLAAGSLRYEMVICDGGSTDGTLDWLKGAQHAPPLRGELRVIEHGELRGAVRAYNDAFRAARGKYTAWINDDLKLEAGSLEAAVGMLEADPEIGMVSLAYQNPGANRSVFSVAYLEERSFPFACYGVLRREDGEKAGWLSEHFYHYCGDIWLSAYIQLMGKRLVELENYTAEHYRAPNPIRNGDEKGIGKADMMKLGGVLRGLIDDFGNG